MGRFASPILLICLAVLVADSDSARSGGPLLECERSLGVMGTDLVVRVFGDDEAQLERALDAAIAELERVEDLMTDWRPSPLTRLNAAAGKGPQPTDPELVRILDRSLRLGEVTAGAFDVSFAGVGQLWDFKRVPALLPDSAAVRDALSRVDYRRVRVDVEGGTVDLPARMRLGLGGIAKGYGVDRAMAVLMEQGIEHAVVSAGGDMKLLGRRQGELWEVAIKHPRERDSVMALLRVSNTCVVTSGDYERFFELDGRRYHHILDPRTGYPSQGCLSATVVGPSAEDADALATALCVLEPRQGLELVEALPRTEALLVGMDGRVRVTSGLRGALTPSYRTDQP